MIVGRVLQRGRKVSPNMVLDGRWRSVCVSVSVCVCVWVDVNGVSPHPAH